MKIGLLMSGGVDSSVSALLLKEKGCQVLGITMISWDDSAARKARDAARFLGIEHRTVDLRKLFQERVIEYFCSSYSRAETPNPCVECNKHIKFGALLDLAREWECDSIATGHYARIERSPEGRYLLKRAADYEKDQSYFLYGLRQEQLARVAFPLGEMHKSEVVALAREHGLPAAGERESQEICFIASDYRQFLKDRISFHPGEVVDEKGNVLGVHRGLPFYTVGQRKGLGISGKKPLYVLNLDLKTNRLCLGEEKGLFRKTLLARECNFISIPMLNGSLSVQVKIRYKAPLAQAIISSLGADVKVEFIEAQRAATPGQSVVFYQGDWVVGGGVIKTAY